jgi:hypothetical protein
MEDYITEDWLSTKGFSLSKNINYYYSLEVKDSDPLDGEYLAIELERGNGNDPNCWDVIFRRIYTGSLKYPDRVTLRHGIKRQSEVEKILSFFIT